MGQALVKTVWGEEAGVFAGEDSEHPSPVPPGPLSQGGRARLSRALHTKRELIMQGKGAGVIGGICFTSSQFSCSDLAGKALMGWLSPSEPAAVRTGEGGVIALSGGHIAAWVAPDTQTSLENLLMAISCAKMLYLLLLRRFCFSRRLHAGRAFDGSWGVGVVPP